MFSRYGVFMEVGPQNWQILQQEKGMASILLSGRWESDMEKNGQETVVVRVVHEETGGVVIPYTECFMQENQRWKIKLDIPTGGLYRIDTALALNNSGSYEWVLRGDRRYHIGVGDLYVIAGQSNAAGYGRDEVSDPPETGVHIMRSNGAWDLASHPLHDHTDSIFKANCDRSSTGHSPWLAFAKKLKTALHYPIGLIPAALGGSCIDQWNPDCDTGLYANMMKMITAAGGRIKGLLWFQGESDTEPGRAASYLSKFTHFVEHLRLDIGMLPVYTVQLCRLMEGDSSGTEWGFFREIQRQAAKNIKDVFIIPSSDLDCCDMIHLTSKSNLVLGARIAGQVLQHTYHIGTDCDAPDIRSICQINPQELLLAFEHVSRCLLTHNAPADELGFLILDELGNVDISGYEIVREKIRLRTARPLCGMILVSLGWEKRISGIIPYSETNYIPALSFFEFQAEKNLNCSK